MGRKNVPINPIRGERLKTLLQERKIQQDELADRIGYSKEHISYICNGKRNLTEEAAEAIAKMFPPVRVEWLLGYDDYMTVSHQLTQAVDDLNKETSLLLSGLSAFAVLAGYSIETSASKTRESIEDLFSELHSKYKIRKGGESVTLSISEMNQFENEVLDFVELKLKHLFKQKGVDI